MSAIRTNYMRIHLAAQFLESFSEASPNNYYMFLGKTSEWPSEPTADVPVSTFEQDDRAHWNDMLGGEQITANEVTHAIPRVDWTTGTVYAEYDDQDAALFSKEFYVLTDESNVYLCVDNGGGAQSTIKPTGTGTTIFTTTDDYRWKYLWTMTVLESTTYLTTAWMPVKFLDADDGSNQWDVQVAAVDGAIAQIQIVDGGSGYTVAPDIDIVGDGVGATATAVINGGEVTDVLITAQGSGYHRATAIVSGGDGVGADVRVVHSPKGGHGANPVLELGAYYILMNVQFSQDETGTLPTDNDFRKIGILKDPTDYGTATPATASNFNQTTRVQLEAGFSGTFLVDEVATGLTSGTTAQVVDWDSVNRILYLNELEGTGFEDGEIVQTASGSGTVSTSGVTSPDLEPGSGQVIYIDQRAAIGRAVDQTETIKTIFEF